MTCKDLLSVPQDDGISSRITIMLHWVRVMRLLLGLQWDLQLAGFLPNVQLGMNPAWSRVDGTGSSTLLSRGVLE